MGPLTGGYFSINILEKFLEICNDVKNLTRELHSLEIYISIYKENIRYVMNA